MSSMSSMRFSRGVSALAAVAGVAMILASAPARAGDDGAAPIWMGFGSVLGLVKSDNDVQIDYRERGKLVLPPKIALPQPGATAMQANPAWPVDPDVEKAKKEKAAAKEIKNERIGRLKPAIVKPGVPVVVTVSATAGQGPSLAPCANKDPKTGECPQKPGPAWNYNPLTWVGIQKKAPNVLGPEPDRDWLTDPPKGYRAPVEGVGAVADN